MNNDLISRSKLLKLFENLKKKSVNLRDVIYLEGVMAVIETAPTANTERSRKNKAPCDLCMYDPPSSFGGKPCSMCPACAKMGGS
jgi:hypothetical protein